MRTGRRKRPRLLTALAAALMVLSNLGGVSAATAPTWRFWELTRVTTGATQIFPVVSASYGESRVVLAGAFLHRSRTGSTVLPGGAILSDEGRAAPSAHGGGRALRCTQTACAAVPARGFDLLGLTYQDSGATSSNVNVVLLAAYGVDIQISAKERGWSLREVRRRAAARWATDGAGASGVHSQKAGVEVFESASLPGGRQGSIALAQLPCTSQFGLGTSGAGTATLTGGAGTVTSRCPDGNGALGAAARGAVTWRLTGPVIGTTAVGFSTPGPVRLLVLSP